MEKNMENNNEFGNSVERFAGVLKLRGACVAGLWTGTSLEVVVGPTSPIRVRLYQLTSIKCL